MTKFVPLNEAAQKLGLTPEQLVEARDRNEIHGYRDGGSWKFKEEEVERFAAERKASDVHGDELAADDDDSILVSEDEMPRGSSTIIGASVEKQKESSANISDSDLLLSDDDLGSDVLAGGSSPQMPNASDSDVQLVLDDDGSDVKIVPGSSSKILADSGSDLKLDLGGAGSSGTGELDEPGGSLGTDEFDEDLSLSDDDELVLSGSGTGSDVTISGSDTGINLASPRDSGLSLDDEALDLGSVSSLELPEDEEGDEMLDLDEPVVEQDKKFLLSPAGELADDEDTSGSQIIELDPSFEMPEDAAEAGFEAGAVAVDADMAPAEAGVRYVPMVEAPYSIYNVLFLFCSVAVLTLCGILMFDVVRNMWSWNEATDRSVASSIMDGIVNALSLNK